MDKMERIFACVIISIQSFVFVLNLDNECPGGRGTESGVCYSYAGDRCDAAHHCDVDLGYTCLPAGDDVMKCMGKHNLRPVDIGQTYFTLRWDDFKPEKYRFEYSARLTTVYNSNLSTWSTSEIGSSAVYNFTYQSPGTTYFVTIGVWEDENFTLYQDTTEILIVKTQDVHYCEFHFKHLAVGESIYNKCISKCTCLSNGSITCGPVCEDPVDNRKQITSSEKECCCPVSGCHQHADNVGLTSAEKSIVVDVIILDVTDVSAKMKLHFLQKLDTARLYFCIDQPSLQNTTHRSEIGWNVSSLEVRKLRPNVTYRVWIECSVNDVVEFLSIQKLFKTHSVITPSQKENTTSSSLGKITPSKAGTYLAVICSMVAVLIILTVAFLLIWRRTRRRKKGQTLSFDNKMFGFDASFRWSSIDHI